MEAGRQEKKAGATKAPAAPSASSSTAAPKPSPSPSAQPQQPAVAGAVAATASVSGPYRALPVPANVATTRSASPGTMTSSATGAAAAHVYRSLEVPMSARDPFDVVQQQFAGMTTAGSKGGKNPAGGATSASTSTSPANGNGPSGNSNGAVSRLPMPLDLYPLSKTHTWMSDADGAEVLKRVLDALDAAVVQRGGSVEQRANVSKFDCRAMGDRACEFCEFVVSVFDTREERRASGTFLIEVERRSGSPFVFMDAVRIMSDPSAAAQKTQAQQPPPPAFVPPELPPGFSEPCGCGQGLNCACTDDDIRAVLSLALSNVYEQREQAVCCIADACVSDQLFAHRLAALRAEEQLRPLLTDKNPIVRRAAERIAKIAAVAPAAAAGAPTATAA